MFRLALKSLLGRKLRMFLTGFAIIIGVGFVAGSFIFTDTIRGAFDGVFDDVYESVDVIVRPSDLGEDILEGFDESVLAPVQGVEGIQHIEPGVASVAFIQLADGSITGTQGPPSLGFSWGRVPALNPLRISDGNGRPPEAAGEVAVDRNTATQNNIALGDVVNIQASDTPLQEFTVVGLASFGDEDSLAGATLVLFEFEQAQTLFGLEGRLSDISIAAADGTTPEELRDRINPLLPSGAEAILGEQQRNEDVAEISEGLGFLTTALLAFAGVSVFVGAFIIQNTFRIIIAQRSKELALLRSIGAVRTQIIRLVSYEAVMVALFASALGVLVGIGLATSLRLAINATGASIPDGPLTIAPRTIYISFAVGVIVTFLSALLPALKASRVSPIEAMRDVEATTPRRSLQTRALIGILVTGIGVAALLYGLFASVSDPVYYVGGGAGIMFLGVSTLSPLLTKPVANLLGKGLDLLYGMIGRIAKQNAKRSPRRTASTAAALMIGVSLVSFATIFASSAKATIDDIFTQSFPGDISITSQLISSDPGDPFGDTVPPPVASDIEALPEVSEVTRLKYDGSVTVNGNEDTLVVGVDADTFNDTFRLKPTDDSYANLTLNTLYVRQNELDKLGLAIGDSIDVVFERTGAQRFTISGAFEDAFDSPYLASTETFAAHSRVTEDLLVVANVSPNFTLEEGRDAIKEAAAVYPIVQVQDKNELIAEVRTQIDQALVLLTGLLGFAIIIAILGITNTLTLSVTERTREIGMMRAIGMTRRQVRRMIRVESIIIAVFGSLLGMLMGIFFSWAILRSLQDLGFTTFSIPVVQLAIYLIVAMIAGVFAAIFPSYKASRMNILDAINYE